VLPNPTANAPYSAGRGLDNGRLSLSNGVILLGEGQEPGCSRKGRSAGRISEASEPQRATGAHFLVEDRGRHLGYAVKLAAAANEDCPTAGQLIHTACLETAAHQLEGLLDAWPDDANQDRARNVVGSRAILLPDQRNVDD